MLILTCVYSIAYAAGANKGAPTCGEDVYFSPLAAEATDIENLITHYFENILGREPAEGGLTYWSGEITRLESLGVDIKEGFIVLAKSFFNIQEYLDRDRDNDEYVTDLYNTFFDREPAPGGLTYWTGQLTLGVSRNLILNYFMFSDEFNDYMEQIFGVSETRPENNMVNDYYRGLLSRIPGNEGFNYWLERFRDEQCYGDAESIRALALEIASGFIYTSEYTNRNRDDLGYIEDIYDAFMRRGGDSGGVNHFLTGLSDGTYTRDELLQIFVNSPEFQGRVQDVIDAGVDDIECPIRYTISGTVTGDVQDGVTITLTGDDSDTTTTDSNGDYSFTGLSTGSYMVTPSKSGYTFDPTYENVIVSNNNETGVSFYAYCAKYPGTASGNIYGDRVGTWTGSADNNGTYTISVSTGEKFIGTISLSGYFSATSNNGIFSVDGNIDCFGNVSGTWQGIDGSSGTFSGTGTIYAN